MASFFIYFGTSASSSLTNILEDSLLSLLMYSTQLIHVHILSECLEMISLSQILVLYIKKIKFNVNESYESSAQSI